jgi:hypothetical protein
MFGALLSRVPDTFMLMGAFHFLYIVNDSFVGCLRHFRDHGWSGSTWGTWVGPHARAYCRILVALQYSAGHNSGNLYPCSVLSTCWNATTMTFAEARRPLRNFSMEREMRDHSQMAHRMARMTSISM